MGPGDGGTQDIETKKDRRKENRGWLHSEQQQWRRRRAFFIPISPRACRSVNVGFLFFKVPISGEVLAVKLDVPVKRREQPLPLLGLVF